MNNLNLSTNEGLRQISLVSGSWLLIRSKYFFGSMPTTVDSHPMRDSRVAIAFLSGKELGLFLKCHFRYSSFSLSLGLSLSMGSISYTVIFRVIVVHPFGHYFLSAVIHYELISGVAFHSDRSMSLLELYYQK
jgi:hypothetical protein